MDDVQLANLIAGQTDEDVDIGACGDALSQALRVPIGTKILLSRYSYTKIGLKHKEIEFSDFMEIPDLLRKGFIYHGRDGAAHVVHVMMCEPKPQAWKACFKRTVRSEIYMIMFHRYRFNEAARIYRRSIKRNELLRDHKDELARRAMRPASHQ